MESARKRAVDGQGLRRPRQIRTSHLLRRDHQVRHRPYRAAEHHCRGLEEAGAVQADRAQGYRPPRRSIESQRNGQVWNRRADSGHGLRLGIGGSSRRRQGRSPHMGDVTKIKGVTKVIPLPFGVAVIGDTVEATRAGRNALKVKWDTTGAAAANTDGDKAREDYARHGKDPNAKTMVEYEIGDAAKALTSAAKVVEATYWSEYCYHAQMEPMSCVAKVSEDSQSAEIWTGTQFGALAANIISGILKTTPDKIKINQQLLGGGYGRRIWPDAAIQATIQSNITKKPVKLILTREDDVAAARPRPMTHHVLKAGLDANGNLVGWYHRLVSENVDAVAAPPRFEATGGKDYIGARGLDQAFYGIRNVRGEYVRETRGMRVHAWRGIGSGYNKFAAESFVDEVANAAGKDPLALRLELTKEKPRAQAVIKAVVEMSDFKHKRPGRG